MTSYRIFSDLARNPETGVFLRTVAFYFAAPVEERPRDLAKMNELSDKVAGFVHDASLIEANGVNPDAGVADAYAHLAPMIDTDRYMRWLMQGVRRAGCAVVRGRISGPLADQERHLRDLFAAEAIVNCSGLGAIELAGDDMYPLRGALVRVKNDGVAMPRIEGAHCMAHDPSSPTQDMVFIVPRGRNMVVLGGLTEPDEWSLDIGLHNYAPVREMLARCRAFLPSLAKAELDAREPVRAGLRPFRRGNVALEREADTTIIHNYGHGGSGVTFSWGCAEEAARLVEHVVDERRGEAEAVPA
jgi:D-amino-acid oxidase